MLYSVCGPHVRDVTILRPVLRAPRGERVNRGDIMIGDVHIHCAINKKVLLKMKMTRKRVSRYPKFLDFGYPVPKICKNAQP